MSTDDNDGGTALFYIEDGARQDSRLHEPILAAGDDAGAREVSKRVLRRNGWTEARIATFFNE